MIPRIGEVIDLWYIERMCISGWFVRGQVRATVTSVTAVVSHVAKTPAGLVLIRAQTRDGFEYECTRPKNPIEEQLFAAPWRRISNVISVIRPSVDEKAVLLEAVLTYNLHREHCDRQGHFGLNTALVFPGVQSRYAFPQGDAERCQVHNRYHYRHAECAECVRLRDDDIEEIPEQAVA